LVPNGLDDTVWFYAGQPDGTVALPRIIRLLGHGLQAATLADLQGTGDPDLVVAYAESNSIGVLRNQGDGSFAAEQDYPVNGMVPLAIAAGHFRGATELDIAVLGQVDIFTGHLAVFAGNGDGTLAPQGPSTDAGFGPAAIAADFNRDGKDDLALVEGPVRIFLSNGDGTFHESAGLNDQSVHALNGGSTWAAVGDVNQDQCPDVVQFRGALASVFLGNCDGSFTFKEDFNAGDFMVAAEIVDLNHDGHPDLVGSGAEGGDGFSLAAGNLVSIMLGDGTGAFAPPTLYRAGRDLAGLAAVALHSVTFPDLVVASNDGGVAILQNDGTGAFGPSEGDAFPTTPLASLSTGLISMDVDGDGRPDLVTVETDSDGISLDVAVMLNRGDRSYGQPIISHVAAPASAIPGFPVDFMLANFRADGLPDLVVATTGQVIFVPNMGAGNFAAQGALIATDHSLPALGSGDLNGDGHTDLVVLDPGSVRIFLGGGDGTFTESSPAPVPLYPYPPNDFNSAVFVRDLNGDGHPDVLISDGSNLTDDANEDHVFEFLGRGDGSLGSAVPLPGIPPFLRVVSFRPGGPPGIIATQGDKDLNSSYPNSAPAQIAVFRGQPDGSFVPGPTYAGFPDLDSVSPIALRLATSPQPEVGDFNGDGNSDVAVFTRFDVGYPETVQMLFGNGDGTFYPAKDQFSVDSIQATPYLASGENGSRDGLAELDNTSASFHALSMVPAPGLQLRTDPNPLTVQGGILTLALNQVPLSDTVVQLSSSDPAIQLPAEMTVPAGASSVTVAYQIGSGLDRSHVFSFTATLGAESAVAYAWEPPGLVAYPLALSFPEQKVGTSSAPQTITLTNFGDSAVALGTLSSSFSSFPISTNCAANLASASSCTVSVTFAPIDNQTIKANLSASTMTKVLAVYSGIGIPQAANLWVSPGTEMRFPDLLAGTTSAPQPLAIYNAGTAAVAIQNISAPAPFSQTNNCPATLPPQAGCTVEVQVTPRVSGPAVATFTFTSDEPSFAAFVTLVANGLVEPMPLQASPNALNFFSETVGAATPPLAVMLTATGSSPVPITSISAATGFSEQNSCPSLLNPGQSCTVQVTFAPLVSGVTGGSLVINGSPSFTPLVLSLSGNAQDSAFTPAPGGSLAATVAAGSTANLQLEFLPFAGASAPYSYSCTGAPSGVGCTVAAGTPAPLTLSIPLSVTITTTAGSGAIPLRGSPFGDGMLRMLLMLAACVGAWYWQRRIRAFAIALVGALALTGCGGGGGARAVAPSAAVLLLPAPTISS